MQLLDYLQNQNIYFWLFMIWSFPLSYYRSRFRKIVYQTENWRINIQPLFKKEVTGLFGNLYPEDKNYLKMRNFYRFYLVGYFLLFVLWRWY